MNQFRALEGVPGRAALIEAAVHAYSESEALSTISEGSILADIRTKRTVLRIDFLGLPLAVLKDGTHVFVCSYDYLTNTRELAAGVSAYRMSKPKVDTVLVMTGDMSEAATRTMESARIVVVRELAQIDERSR
jgi:hypothetical protein